MPPIIQWCRPLSVVHQLYMFKFCGTEVVGHVGVHNLGIVFAAAHYQSLILAQTGARGN